jgi:hypothetical protein
VFTGVVLLLVETDEVEEPVDETIEAVVMVEEVVGAELDEMVLEVETDTELDVEIELAVEVELVDGRTEEELEVVPCWALACIAKVMYPPTSLQNVRYEAWIPVVLGENTNGTTREAPAAKLDPTAGKFGDVYPFPTVDPLTLT